MSIDAVAVFRPKVFEKLLPYLDLDEDSEESTGLYAEKLEDGSVLVHTFQKYQGFVRDPRMARMWLAQFGEDLQLVHDDPRGILLFPDLLEPDGTTYEAVVEEAANECLWVPQQAATKAELATYEAELMSEVEAIQKDPQGYAEALRAQQAQFGAGLSGAGLPGGLEGIDLQELSRHFDMSKIEDMAAKLVSGGNLGSFDIGSLVSSVQKQFAEALGAMPTQEAKREGTAKEKPKG
jgi:hypothetical protein